MKSATSWKPGQSGNPHGRPAGSRDRLTSAFIDKLSDDFARNGKKAIQACRRDDPAAYLRLVASLVPKELHLSQDNPLEQFSDEEIAALLQAASQLADA